MRIFALALLAMLPGCVRYEPRPLSLSATGESVASRSLGDPALHALLNERLPQRSIEWPLKHWDLDALTVAAFHINPAFATADAQWQSAAAASITAAGRPNPTVGLQGGYNFDAWRGLPAGGGANPWIPGASIDLPIETAGKRRLRIEKAHHLAGVARLNVVVVAWQLRASLRTALVEHQSASRRLALISRQMAAQDEVIRLLESRLQAGAVSRTEVSQQRSIRLRLETDAADARRARLESLHRIAEVAGVPAAALSGLELDPPPATSILEAPALNDARRLALTSRADIRAALSSYEAAQTALQIEIARQYPDLHLGNGYQWDQGDNKWSFGVTLELPILNRNQGPIAEAEAHRTEARGQVLAIQSHALAEIERAATLAKTLSEQLQHARAVLANLESGAQLEQQRFAAGASDRVSLASARIEAMAAEQTVLDVEARLQLVSGQLVDALQIPAPPMDFDFPPPTGTEGRPASPIRKDPIR